ncbi:serine/threonine/tyrosine-interacting protein A-like [Oppia nitens]|uniref:serine/threonine/tyrosine-interacting protein A-like n=1 Tax=Oppia nitens TaxID=1686743 RepID=UPI0023DBA9C9|nr:serine/threonine/tyrosine-interacting protein A-like [Oppia nitens]
MSLIFGDQPSEDEMNQNEAIKDNNNTVDDNNAANFEWEYAMRRQMQQIVPNLWLGPYAAALKTKEEELCRVGITHIVCVRQDIESHWIRPNFPSKYKYLCLDIADTPTQQIIPHFPVVSRFIDECFQERGAVLIHGNAGISRSAALVIAYIMEKQNLTANQAIRVVQSKRFCIFPNEGFRQQLQEYEPILQARGIPLASSGGVKRSFSEEDSENMDTNQI